MFVPGEPLKTSVMFAGKAGAYMSEAPFRCSILGLAPGLPTNIRLGWNSLLGTSSLLRTFVITAVKSFIELATGPWLVNRKISYNNFTTTYNRGDLCKKN